MITKCITKNRVDQCLIKFKLGQNSFGDNDASRRLLHELF